LVILFIADIMGKPGRYAVATLLTPLKKKYTVDFVIANVENAAGGFGVTKEIAHKIFHYGVDCQTNGNHVWDRRELLEFIGQTPNMLRPANFPPGTPGSGSGLFTTKAGVNIGVINLQGRIFMAQLDCPFRAADKEIEKLKSETNVIIVDFHAEATSEKQALGWYLDGRVSAVLGTHTHVQTADETILPNGTAYITDAGMTGPHHSVIGINKEDALERFVKQLPRRFTIAEKDVKLCAILLEIDEKSGEAKKIERLRIDVPKAQTDEVREEAYLSEEEEDR